MEETIYDILEENLFREYVDNNRCGRTFFKRFDTPTRCNANSNKPGIQVCIYVSDLTHNGKTISMFEIELGGELKDETWFKIQQWGFVDDIYVGFKAIPRMIAAWELAANFSTE